MGRNTAIVSVLSHRFFAPTPLAPPLVWYWFRFRVENGWPPEPLTPKPEPVDIQINYGGGVQREHLAKDEAADDGNAKGSPQLAALAYTDCQEEAHQAWLPWWSS